MNERHADRLYRRLLEGGELAEADRLHLADCEACRLAVAEVDRLDQRLETAAATLVTESLPPGVLDERRPASTVRRWQLAIGVAAIAVIATLSFGPVANLLVADASPTPSASATDAALPTTTPSAEPSGAPEPLPPGLIAGPDLCGNGAAGFEIRVPDGWYANAGGGLDPACTRLAPEPFDFTASVDAPVRVVAMTGTFEEAMAVVDRKEAPAPESVTLAGYPALRLEYPATPAAADQQLAYVVSADGAPLESDGQGRYLVAMTTQGATYERDASALDDAMRSLFFFAPMVEDPAIAAAADALMADTDSCQSPDGAYSISFPNSWHTAEDGRCAAFAAGPLPGPFGDYAGDEMYPDAQITLGISEGAFGSIEPAISLDRFWLAGSPAMRLELQSGVLSPGPTRSYSYVIGLGPSFDAGPNFIAATSNTRPGDYALNRAVLDRMMATLTFADEGPPPDTLSGIWRQTADPPIGGRNGHRMVWTGSEVIVWGGIESSEEQATSDLFMPSHGAAYDPVTDTWRRTSDAPIDGRYRPVVVWTGSRMLVWGGEIALPGGYAVDGAIYNPATDQWRSLPNAPLKASDPVGGWVAGRFVVVTDTHAAAYTPETDSWEPLPSAPVRPGMRSAVVIGDRLVVVAFGDGSSGEPEGAILEGGAWTPISVPMEPLDAGVEFVAGGELVLVPTAGWALDPSTRDWHPIGRCPGAANGGAWTGTYLIGVTSAYDPARDRCLELPPSPPRAMPFDTINGREFAVGVWTGTEYVTWSGGTYLDTVWTPNDGAVFRPRD